MSSPAGSVVRNEAKPAGGRRLQIVDCGLGRRSRVKQSQCCDRGNDEPVVRNKANGDARCRMSWTRKGLRRDARCCVSTRRRSCETKPNMGGMRYLGKADVAWRRWMAGTARPACREPVVRNKANRGGWGRMSRICKDSRRDARYCVSTGRRLCETKATQTDRRVRSAHKGIQSNALRRHYERDRFCETKPTLGGRSVCP